MSILIISTSYSDHAQRVKRSLVEIGQEVVNFNLDLANLDAQPIVVVKNGTEQFEVSRLNDSVLREVTGVFVHHPIIELPVDYGVDELDSTLCRSSWANTIDWLEQSLHTAVWVNAPSISQRASSSLRQLRLAKECGFQIPATIFTNDLPELQNFAKEHEQVILKSGNLLGLRIKGQRMLARIVDISKIDSSVLARAPCFFQEYINKIYELRVHVVGSDVFACKIESQRSAKTHVDWRNYDLRNTPHEALELNTDLTYKCRAIVKALGLRMGILDLIRTPNGNIVFLECNAQGHWIWIEELTGLPITQCLCDELISSS